MTVRSAILYSVNVAMVAAAYFATGLLGLALPSFGRDISLSLVVFHDLLGLGDREILLTFLPFPILIWIALRTDSLTTSFANLSAHHVGLRRWQAPRSRTRQQLVSAFGETVRA